MLINPTILRVTTAPATAAAETGKHVEHFVKNSSNIFTSDFHFNGHPRPDCHSARANNRLDPRYNPHDTTPCAHLIRHIDERNSDDHKNVVNCNGDRDKAASGCDAHVRPSGINACHNDNAAGAYEDHHTYSDNRERRVSHEDW
jgi:hypothetical protein